MKVMIQWAQKNPQDWQQIDSSEWINLPKKDIPKKNEFGGEDDQLGWIRNVSVQGITCEGYDHIAIEPITIGLDEGIKYIVWNDDPDDYPVGKRQAIIWIILPLAPDPKLGMAINTRQSCVRYYEGEKYDRLVINHPQNTAIRPWHEFVYPPEESTRHGVWLSDEKFIEHKAIAPQAKWSWMHWNEHLPEDECEIASDGCRVLKEQRKQGRYQRSERTITYYQRDTNRAIAFDAFTHEDALELTTGSSTTESVTLNANSVAAWIFTTSANEPNSADWPNGAYHVQFNCTAVSAEVIYGTFSGGRINFWRISADLTTSLETSAGDLQFSGTGLKLLTRTWNPSSGNATDVYSVATSAEGFNHGDAITFTLNTSDSYADGPWPGGAPPETTTSIQIKGDGLTWATSVQ